MGYTQRRMADILGITQATYNRIENEVSRPSDEILERIADILQLEKSELYEGVWDEWYQESDKRSWRSRIFPARTSTRGQADRAASDEEYKQGEHVEKLSPRDIPALIKELKELADAGAITAEEFETKKRDLLARL